MDLSLRHSSKKRKRKNNDNEDNELPLLDECDFEEENFVEMHETVVDDDNFECAQTTFSSDSDEELLLDDSADDDDDYPNIVAERVTNIDSLSQFFNQLLQRDVGKF